MAPIEDHVYMKLCADLASCLSISLASARRQVELTVAREGTKDLTSKKIIAERLGPNLCNEAKSAVSPKKMPINPEHINTWNEFTDNSLHDPVIKEIPASKKNTMVIRILLNANGPSFLIGYIEIKPVIAQQKAAPNADISAINIVNSLFETN